ncbi:iron-sulfur cluster assembly accessory protein [soil metagenome]
METTINIPVSFTKGAVNEIKRLIAAEGFDNSKYLRIGVKGGGCSGMTYVLGFEARTEIDEVYNANEFSFIMNPAHGIYLTGMEINWEGGLNSRGFTFKNPNAGTTCGCGTSFSV